MQAIESQNLILYQTDLRGQWPQEAAEAFARRLPYARRLALRSAVSAGRASLAGIALALRALTRLLGRIIEPGEIHFAAGEKPRLAAPAADFSISHAGPWAACAALLDGRVGLDLEAGRGRRTADFVVREAVLKASGAGLRAFQELAGLRMDAEPLHWRGERWHLRRLEAFEGACACIASSREVRAVETHAIALAELFGS
jgi:phosphopantetheinyl transferase